MTRNAIVGIALLLFLMGCSDKSEPEQTPIQTAEQHSTVQETQQATENLEAKPDETQEEENKEELILTEELKTYLYENFGGAGNPEFATSWYKYIEDVKVSVHEDELEVTIYTSIYPDDEGKEFAQKFFPPIWGWANSDTDPKNVVFAVVLGKNNRLLATQTNPLY